MISIGAAIKYTAGKTPYGYSTLGDMAVFIFFGLVAVLGTYYLHVGKFDHGFFQSIIPACSIGLLATGVLNINNIRDIEGDTENGKITLAVKLGKKGAEVYQLLLNVVAIGLLIYFFQSSTAHDGLLIALVGLLFIVHWLVLRSLNNTKAFRSKYNAMLKFHVLLTQLNVIMIGFILL
ncbi:MAG: 1,4-dihydroxy-2-naphthoate octaprenyltransferase [Bacteroidia bacterium]